MRALVNHTWIRRTFVAAGNLCASPGLKTWAKLSAVPVRRKPVIVDVVLTAPLPFHRWRADPRIVLTDAAVTSTCVGERHSWLGQKLLRRTLGVGAANNRSVAINELTLCYRMHSDDSKSFVL